MMGQANARGTFEDRVAQAKEKASAHLLKQQAAVKAEFERRKEEIAALPPAAQEIINKQDGVMYMARGRYQNLVMFALTAASKKP